MRKQKQQETQSRQTLCTTKRKKKEHKAKKLMGCLLQLLLFLTLEAVLVFVTAFAYLQFSLLDIFLLVQTWTGKTQHKK